LDYQKTGAKADEKFPDQQKPLFLLLAQKENREEASFMGNKHHRKGYPYLWKRGGTR
jgi:hypothetical protein